MMESVATPIESLMTGVDYMNYMYSTNDNYGNMVLTVNFDVATNPNTDQILTQLRESQASPQLPAMVNTTGVVVQKSRAAAMMVIVVLFTPRDLRPELSDQLRLHQLRG